MTALTLGPVSFEAFEIPAQIAFGGRQRLAIHALPGGLRVIDAMGRDDAPIAWSGVFSGGNAGERARLLDLLRAAGQPLTLVWDEFVVQVVIASFDARFQLANWIPYRLTCVVLSNLALPAQLAVSLTADLLGDLTSASACPGLDVSVATAALSVSSGASLGTQAYAQSTAALGAASAQASGLLDVGATALSQAQTVPQATAAAGQMAQASAALGYLQRAQGNLSRAAS